MAQRGARKRESVTPASPVRVEIRPEEIRDFETARAYLRSRVNFERARTIPRDGLKLDRMRAICELLGCPERATRFVHIAGSKGKGGVAEMLAAALRGCGYTTGLYTSPHLVSERERIRIDGHEVGQREFARLLSHVAGVCEDLPEEMGEATYFEILTGMALLHFAEQAVDVGVLETGLGGRLDATNVVTPEVCVLTTILHEHTHVLGETLEEIALEKAGILKPRIPAVCAPQDEGVLDIFREQGELLDAPIMVLGEQITFSERFESSPDLGPHMRIGVSIGDRSYEHIACPLRGHHQGVNCGLALAALLLLGERGFETDERDVALGLARTRENGRLERVWDQPRIYVDGAHTPESVRLLIQSLGSFLRYDSLFVVFGCTRDKDIDGMLDALARGADKVFFTRAEDSPRGVEGGELLERFQTRSDKMAQSAPSVRDAINLAYRGVQGDDVIVVTGSFHVAGEAKRLFLAKRGS